MSYRTFAAAVLFVLSIACFVWGFQHTPLPAEFLWGVLGVLSVHVALLLASGDD